MRRFLLILLILWAVQLSAQSDDRAADSDGPVFAQLGLGVFPHLEAFCLEFSAAAGYRFSSRLGLGAEYRLTSLHDVSIGRSANLLGLHLRGQFDRGWLATLGIGTVLSASESDDGFAQYEYRSGGYYLATDLGYQFRWGGALGLYLTVVRGQTFDNFEYNQDTDRYEPLGTTHTDNFPSLGVKFSYVFFGRGKQNAAGK